MITQWESELDEFVSDIQARLENVAASITTTDDQSVSHATNNVAPYDDTPNESAAIGTLFDVSNTSKDLEHVRADDPSDSIESREMDEPKSAAPFITLNAEGTLNADGTSIESDENTDADETTDRLQAIKQKLAARLQGE